MKEDFNKASKNYDEVFTDSLIGKAQRERVYHWLNKSNLFDQKRNWLEINCGTGHDANIIASKGNFVIGTDASSGMINVAREKYPDLKFEKLKFDELQSHFDSGNTDVIFSNFGGLNCIESFELKEFVNDIGHIQKAGQHLAFVIMPKYCLTEILFFGLRFKFKKAFQRSGEFAIVNVEGVQVKTFYHSPRLLKKYLEDSDYAIQSIKPISLFIPSSYMEKWMVKFPFLLKLLYFHERILGQFKIGANFSDHYIIIAEKK